MDAAQFQGAVIAWSSALTVAIGAVVGVALAVRSAVEKIRDAVAANGVAVAALSVTAAVHERQLNGELAPRIEAVVDKRIAIHRRPGDGV